LIQECISARPLKRLFYSPYLLFLHFFLSILFSQICPSFFSSFLFSFLLSTFFPLLIFPHTFLLFLLSFITILSSEFHIPLIVLSLLIFLSSSFPLNITSSFFYFFSSCVIACVLWAPFPCDSLSLLFSSLLPRLVV